MTIHVKTKTMKFLEKKSEIIPCKDFIKRVQNIITLKYINITLTKIKTCNLGD